MIENDMPLILEKLFHHAQEHGDKPAFIFVDRRGHEKELISYAQLYLRSSELALLLKQRYPQGENIALVYQPGIRFVISMLACWMADRTVVPLPPNNFIKLPMQMRRLLLQANVRWILCDSVSSKIALLPFADQTIVTDNFHAHDINTPASTVNAMIPMSVTSIINNNAIIQFTSGSTSAPKGVVIGHDNLAANLRMIMQGFEHNSSSTVAGWTPHFHDQGLIGNILQPLYVGASSVLMSPSSFISNPMLWLQIISRYKVYSSGGPNFAYELCVSRIKYSLLEDIDLSCWKAAFNGADVIRANTIKAFIKAFTPYGFGRNAFYPCYGLAESTLACTGGKINEAPTLRKLSWHSLCQGIVQYLPNRNPNDRNKVTQKIDSPLIDKSVTVAGCGKALPGVTVKIVDVQQYCNEEKYVTEDEVNIEAKAGTVGEIWIAGAHIASSYLNDKVNSNRTFNACLQNIPNTRFLRTGDLGFVDSDGELYFVGRSKEIVIQHGQNYTPQDIEATVADSNPILAPDRNVLFSVHEHNKGVVIKGPTFKKNGAPQTSLIKPVLQECSIPKTKIEHTRIKQSFKKESVIIESVILIQEVKKHCPNRDDFASVIFDIRKHVTSTYGLTLDEVFLVKANTIPMTTSGKKQRSKVRQWYSAGKFDTQIHSQGEPGCCEILD